MIATKMRVDLVVQRNGIMLQADDCVAGYPQTAELTLALVREPSYAPGSQVGALSVL